LPQLGIKAKLSSMSKPYGQFLQFRLKTQVNVKLYKNMVVNGQFYNHIFIHIIFYEYVSLSVRFWWVMNRKVFGWKWPEPLWGKIGTSLGNTPENNASPVRTVSVLAGIQTGAFQSHFHHSISEPSFFSSQWSNMFLFAVTFVSVYPFVEALTCDNYAFSVNSLTIKALGQHNHLWTTQLLRCGNKCAKKKYSFYRMIMK
jgi:hypothetical protein